MKIIGICKLLLVIGILVSINTILFSNEYIIATYNIRCIEEKDKIKGDGWDNRVDKICSLILFNDFDIYGVQEANHDQIQDMLKFLGNEYDYSSTGSDDGKIKGSHNAVFFKKEKFELISSGTFWLSDTPNKISKGWDSKFFRICSWVKLLDKGSNKLIYFFNTHLDATGKLAKENGCQLLIDQIKKICVDGNAVLVGDFNSYETDKQIKTISTSKYLFDAYELAKYKWMPNGTYNAFNPLRISSKRLDHIFVTKNINVSRYGIINTFYYITDGKDITNYRKFPYGPKIVKLHSPSDHYPLCAKISIK